MSRVDFYHLTLGDAPVVVARLAERAVAAGARLLIVARERAMQDAIDAALWTANPESFLPHPPPGVATEGEPIEIGDTLAGPTEASAVIVADGIWRDEAMRFERVLFVFDPGAIEAARAAWRGLAAQAGCERRYWKQDGAGRWREGP